MVAHQCSSVHASHAKACALAESGTFDDEVTDTRHATCPFVRVLISIVNFQWDRDVTRR